MRVAVLLQTCERPDLTARTVASFRALNPSAGRFDLLHGDDASTTQDNERIAALHGFRTVVRTTERKGMLATRTALIDAAAHRDAEWVLLLENDCESVKPFPWDLFEWCARRPAIYCLRLFGAFKDAKRKDRCLTVNKWAPDVPVNWKPLKDVPVRAEIGTIHWTAQPAVTRTRDALGIHTQGWRPTKAKTVRVIDNVMVHIGAQRTPGRMP